MCVEERSRLVVAVAPPRSKVQADIGPRGAKGVLMEKIAYLEFSLNLSRFLNSDQEIDPSSGYAVMPDFTLYRG